MRVFVFRRLFDLRRVGVEDLLKGNPGSCDMVSFDVPRGTNGFRWTPSAMICFKLLKPIFTSLEQLIGSPASADGLFEE
jgi:hypothetical protein